MRYDVRRAYRAQDPVRSSLAGADPAGTQFATPGPDDEFTSKGAGMRITDGVTIVTLALAIAYTGTSTIAKTPAQAGAQAAAKITVRRTKGT